MTIHIGEITSEVRTNAPVGTAAAPDTAASASIWDERVRIVAIVERVTRDRLRTTTGATNV